MCKLNRWDKRLIIAVKDLLENKQNKKQKYTSRLSLNFKLSFPDL